MDKFCVAYKMVDKIDSPSRRIFAFKNYKDIGKAQEDCNTSWIQNFLVFKRNVFVQKINGYIFSQSWLLQHQQLSQLSLSKLL